MAKERRSRQEVKDMLDRDPALVEKVRRDFERKTEQQPGGCLVHANKNKSGKSSRCSVRGVRFQTHHIAWYLAKGEWLGSECELHHACKNPRCIKVEHLIPLNRTEHRLLSRAVDNPKALENLLGRASIAVPAGCATCDGMISALGLDDFAILKIIRDSEEMKARHPNGFSRSAFRTVPVPVTAEVNVKLGESRSKEQLE